MKQKVMEYIFGEQKRFLDARGHKSLADQKVENRYELHNLNVSKIASFPVFCCQDRKNDKN